MAATQTQAQWAPSSIEELRTCVRENPCVLACGARTKGPLTATNAKLVSLTQLRGIIDYEPSEFTFTALAGTPVSEIRKVLSEHRQYLPFDPLLADAGATIGGTVAASAAGPGRFRYGGVGIFLLEFVMSTAKEH